MLLLLSPMQHAIQCHTHKQNLIKQKAISCTAWYWVTGKLCWYLDKQTMYYIHILQTWHETICFVSMRYKFVYPKSNIHLGVRDIAYEFAMHNVHEHVHVHEYIFPLPQPRNFHVKFSSFFFGLKWVFICTRAFFENICKIDSGSGSNGGTGDKINSNTLVKVIWYNGIPCIEYIT